MGIAPDADDHQIVVQLLGASPIVRVNCSGSGFAASIAGAQLQTKIAAVLGLYWFERIRYGMWLSIKSSPTDAGIRRYNCQKEL